jgi:tetratricopeptide (TPR) repeat protein
MAEANKKEGNELFRDGNHAHAAERYLKALGHCSKMVDVTDAQKVQMAPLKETCHLNLAMCWFKLGKMEKCIENCKDCLSINSSNTKALLRRGLAYEQDKRCHLSFSFSFSFFFSFFLSFFSCLSVSVSLSLSLFASFFLSLSPLSLLSHALTQTTHTDTHASTFVTWCAKECLTAVQGTNPYHLIDLCSALRYEEALADAVEALSKTPPSEQETAAPGRCPPHDPALSSPRLVHPYPVSHPRVPTFRSD